MTATAILASIVDALDLSEATAPVDVQFDGSDALPSCFPVTELAAASIAAVGVMLQALTGHSGPVRVDRRLASLWFGWSIRPDGWDMPPPWDTVAGDYRSGDGWIKLHTNAPHHRAAALRVLACEPERTAVGRAVAGWEADALETAIIAEGGCAAVLRSLTDWAGHAQGMAVAEAPLITWDTTRAPVTSDWRPTAGRPLAGLRVLDLTRVLAGPVATRTLAGYGAQVLRIDPPDWDEPGVIPEVTPGKHCARLDLKSAEGLERLKGLLASADILIHGYRADALAGLGLDAGQRQAIRPGLIDISLNAYGHTGPWAGRRGFDSLVQFSTGIAAAGRDWRNSDAPVSLPVQALDHATGYLLAAAAIRGLIARQEGTGPIIARLSLARTARLLSDHQTSPTVQDFPPASDADFATAVEATHWGRAHRLIPPVTLPDTPMHWTSPACALGSSQPVWSD
jgi:hypothetical protein